jgi:hypothetical protein
MNVGIDEILSRDIKELSELYPNAPAEEIRNMAIHDICMDLYCTVHGISVPIEDSELNDRVYDLSTEIQHALMEEVQYA